MTDSTNTDTAESQTAAGAIEPPTRKPFPISPEMQRLIHHNDALLTILGTILLSRDKTMVLLAKHRESYFQFVAGLGGQAPLIDVQPQGKAGNLIVRLVLPEPRPAMQHPSAPGLEDLLQDVGIKIEIDKLDKLPQEQLTEVAQWAAAAFAKAQGVNIDVPPKPSFLVELESAPVTKEQPASNAE